MPRRSIGTTRYGVLFDFGGTLVDAPNLEACVEVLRSLGVNVEADDFVHVYREVEAELDAQGSVPPDHVEYWRRILQRWVGPGIDRAWVEEFLRRYRAGYPESPLYSDARRCLEALRAEHRRLGVLSNTESEERLRRHLGQLGVEEFFDAVIASGTEGMRKPAPEIFRRAAVRLGLPPGGIVYVGDLPQTDARGAESAGMVGVWLNRNGTGFGEGPREITSLLELPPLLRELEREALR